jgi:hypothetical protein
MVARAVVSHRLRSGRSSDAASLSPCHGKPEQSRCRRIRPSSMVFAAAISIFSRFDALRRRFCRSGLKRSILATTPVHRLAALRGASATGGLFPSPTASSAACGLPFLDPLSASLYEARVSTKKHCACLLLSNSKYLGTSCSTHEVRGPSFDVQRDIRPSFLKITCSLRSSEQRDIAKCARTSKYQSPIRLSLKRRFATGFSAHQIAMTKVDTRNGCFMHPE